VAPQPAAAPPSAEASSRAVARPGVRRPGVADPVAPSTVPGRLHGPQRLHDRSPTRLVERLRPLRQPARQIASMYERDLARLGDALRKLAPQDHDRVNRRATPRARTNLAMQGPRRI
jgi:hypothetical protein